MHFLENLTCPFTGLPFNGQMSGDALNGELLLKHPATNDALGFEVANGYVHVPFAVFGLPNLICAKEASEILNVKRSMLRKLEREGKLHSKSVNGRKHYNVKEVLDYKESRRSYRKAGE